MTTETYNPATSITNEPFVSRLSAAAEYDRFITEIVQGNSGIPEGKEDDHIRLDPTGFDETVRRIIENQDDPGLDMVVLWG